MKITNEVLKSLGGKFFRVSFVKKDGTFREICARVYKDQNQKPGYWLVYDNKDKCLKTILEHNILLIKQGKRFWR